MTDNRTTELLRKLLNERGVEYEAYRDVKNRCITKWRTYHGAFVFFAVEKEGKLFVETASDTDHSAICTPEQAIAATLGNDKKLITIALQLVRDHYCYTERFDESCIELERWCHDHGETDLMEYAMALRCPACAFVPMDDVEDGQSAKLTAKQVREAIRKYAQDDSCYIFEVYGEMCGPIADELNARAERTCDFEVLYEVEYEYGDEWWRLKCSNCGHETFKPMEPFPNYCEECGAKVIGG